MMKHNRQGPNGTEIFENENHAKEPVSVEDLKVGNLLECSGIGSNGVAPCSEAKAVFPRPARKSIGGFLCQNAIHHRMNNDICIDDSMKCTIPSSWELRGSVLGDEVKVMDDYDKKIRRSWANTGCSILLDGWIDAKGQNLVNFIVECPEGSIYLRSADVSAILDNVDALHRLLDEVMDEVGVNNVVQVVASSTTGWMWTIGEQFVERHCSVFWSVSVSHCIDLMLEKIAAVHCVRGILDKAKIITGFIQGHRPAVWNLMRTHMSCYDTTKPSKIKSALPFLMLESIVIEKDNLKGMFASSRSRNAVSASNMEGKRVLHLLGDSSFWSSADMVLRATAPILRGSHSISTSEIPQVGFIYETMDHIKETIEAELGHKRSLYKPFWKAIDDIWEMDLHSPLHAAGYYLNPRFFYSTDFCGDSEVAFGLLCCIVRMVPDKHTQLLVTLQLDNYRYARGAFEDGCAFDTRTSVPPARWWSIYGKDCPDLQFLAIRILSQTCDGALKCYPMRDVAENFLMTRQNHVEKKRL